MYKLKKVFLFCIMCLFCVAVMPKEVEAARYKFDDSTINLRLYEDTDPTNIYLVDDPTSKAECIKVKATKKGIVDVEIAESKRSVDITPRKVGTTTLKVTVKYGKKKKVHKVKVVVRNYENPVVSFKVGGVQYKNKFEKESYYCAKVPKKSKWVTVEVKAKEGYTITNICFRCDTGKKFIDKKLKNGQRFKLRTYKGESVQVCLENNKTGEIEVLAVFYE